MPCDHVIRYDKLSKDAGAKIAEATEAANAFRDDNEALSEKLLELDGALKEERTKASNLAVIVDALEHQMSAKERALSAHVDESQDFRSLAEKLTAQACTHGMVRVVISIS